MKQATLRGALALAACGSLALAANPMPPFAVSVTPDGTAVTQPPSSGLFQAPFVVKNIGSQVNSYFLYCIGRVNIGCDVTDIEYLTLEANEQTDIVAFYNTGATPGVGRVVVGATGDGNAAADTGFYSVTVAPPPGKPRVALRHHNGDNRDRSLCLTAGAGEAAAWQCGDLLVSHSLPGYSTLGRDRALRLVYTSAQAVPRPIVVVSVNEGTVGEPTAVYAELTVSGSVRASATYVGWNAAPTTRQIALAYDASGDSSGLYPFTMLIRNQYAGPAHDSVLADTLIVVNRSTSRFGTGWHLAGVEELRLNQPGSKILWIGGDGSAKVYRSVNATTWVSAAGAYRDTLVRFDSASTAWYRRTLRHGVLVTFNSAGRHVRTTNRVGQSTTFAWSGDTVLTSIVVPPAGQPATTYSLNYAAGNLDAITDPANRVLDATVTGLRLVSLRDPDNYTTGFAYDAAGRMTGRTTRRGFTTRYAYSKGLRVTIDSVRLDSATATFAITTFQSWDEKGLATAPTGQVAVDTAIAYTKIDGPLTALGDSARFWVDRWGGPIKQINPVGAQITAVRGDPSVPALVTRITAADGAITTLQWNARGNLLQRRDSTLHMTNGQATVVSRRTYNAPTASDSPDSLVDSTTTGALVTRFAYNSLGLTDSVISPNGHVTRAEYITGTVDPLRGTLRALIERNVPVWNASALQEQVADVRVAVALNAYGNVVGDTSGAGRIRAFTRDSVQRVIAATDAGDHVTQTEYDPLNRPTRWIRHIESGVQLITRQTFAVDVRDSIIDPRSVVRRFLYDAAGRQIVEYDDYGKPERTYYNAAGLVDSVRQRVFQDSTGSNRVIRMTYDAAGRTVKRFWPARTGVAADSVIFAYDVANRVTTAVNAGLRQTTTYYATGAVRTDVRDKPDGTQPYSNTFGYDRIGRRMWHRVGSPTSNDSTWQTYDAVTGDLKAVGVRWSTGVRDSVRFWWDAVGRRDTVIYTNGTKLKFAYDADSQQRLMCAVHPDNTAGASDVFDLTVHQEQVDADGLVLKLSSTATVGGQQISGCASNATANWGVQNTYDIRHQLLTQAAGGNTASYTYDSSGNVISSGDNHDDDTYVIDPTHNRVVRSDDVDSAGINYRRIHRFDPNGARLADSAACSTGCDPNLTYIRYYYYDGLGRTSGIKTGSVDTMVGPANACTYDPLSRLYGPCEATGIVPKLGYDRENVIRTQPDGDLLGWTFVHGPGLDDPLMGYYRGTGQYVYYVTDGMGRQYAVGTAAGWDYSTDPNYQNNGGKFAGGITNAHGFGAMRFPNASHNKVASFRNRFYDLTTQRWTQEDPLGVAGGLNLYAYADNNPVAFSDPYGTWIFAVLGFVAVFAAEALGPPTVGAALATAATTLGAAALGSAASAGIESLASGGSFWKAFDRNVDIAGGLLFATVAGSLLPGFQYVGAGAHSPIQGFVEVEGRLPWGRPGGLTLGAAAGFNTSPAGHVNTGWAKGTLRAHELGHTIQFIGLSALGGVINPWVPYLGLGAPGFLGWERTNPWENLATWLGR